MGRDELSDVAGDGSTPVEVDTPKGAKHTPGPWGWYGDQYGLYLATTHSGRRYVMGFRRMGMNSAQPVFQVAQRMVPAADLVEFEVGDGTARGFAQGKADTSVYRYQVSAIDAPDARLIAAAPDLLAVARLAAERFREYERSHLAKGTQDADEKAHRNHEIASICEAAIAKALPADGPGHGNGSQKGKEG